MGDSDEEKTLRRDKTPDSLLEKAGGSESLLLVEDQEDLRLLIAKILRRRGYTVFEAATGHEALSVSKQHKVPIHLMLADVVLPRMNGCELAARLAAIHPETRVLYMSGYMGDAIVQSQVLATEAPFLPKPFTADALARKVRQVLDGAAAED